MTPENEKRLMDKAIELVTQWLNDFVNENPRITMKEYAKFIEYVCELMKDERNVAETKAEKMPNNEATR